MEAKKVILRYLFNTWGRQIISYVLEMLIVKGLAMDMETWLKANVTDGECIFNITSSGVAGPFIFDDSRRVYEINLLVGFNIVRVFD